MQSIFSGSVSKRGKSGQYIFFDHFPKLSGGSKIGLKSQPISTNIKTAVLSEIKSSISMKIRQIHEKSKQIKRRRA